MGQLESWLFFCSKNLLRAPRDQKVITMDICIQKVTAEGNELWLVTAGSIQLRFNEQESAIEFCARLKDRVDAPHELPAEAHKFWAEKTELAPV